MKPFLLLVLMCSFCRAAEMEDLEEHIESIDAWTALGKGEWELTRHPERGRILHLRESGPVPATPVRRPANLLLLPSPATRNFILELDVKTPRMDIKGVDICLFLDVRDHRNYTYVHLSNDSDGRVHQVIMRVWGDQKARSTIHREKKPPASLTGEWQTVRLVRKADGGVSVYVDNSPDPVLTATLPADASGRVGIGSFNDPALFDRVRLRAKPEDP